MKNHHELISQALAWEHSSGKIKFQDSVDLKEFFSNTNDGNADSQFFSKGHFHLENQYQQLKTEASFFSGRNIWHIFLDFPFYISGQQRHTFPPISLLLFSHCNHSFQLPSFSCSCTWPRFMDSYMMTPKEVTGNYAQQSTEGIIYHNLFYSFLHPVMWMP